MATLQQMMGSMARKEDVQVAKLETVKEVRAHVESELAPVKAEIDAIKLHAVTSSQLKAEVGPLNNRITVLDARLQTVDQAVASGSLSGEAPPRPNPHDVALRRVAFIGFPESSTVTQRIASMESFMASHFPDVRYGLADMFPDTKGCNQERLYRSGCSPGCSPCHWGG